MNIILDVNQFEIRNIGFLESKKNNIIDGKFTKIIYSDSCLTMNGIFFNFPILLFNVKNNNNIKKSNSVLDNIYTLKTDNFIFDNNKNNISFNINNPQNVNIIKIISEIEIKLIEHYKNETGINKKSFFPLFKQLLSGKIKLYKEGILNSFYHKGLSESNINKDHYDTYSKCYNPSQKLSGESTNDIITQDIKIPYISIPSVPLYNQEEYILNNIVNSATHSVFARNLKNIHPPGFSQIEEFKIYSPINRFKNNFSENEVNAQSYNITENIVPINIKKSPMIILKISGIWETTNEIGITYKFLDMYDV
jgi:hypothetical protein